MEIFRLAWNIVVSVENLLKITSKMETLIDSSAAAGLCTEMQFKCECREYWKILGVLIQNILNVELIHYKKIVSHTSSVSYSGGFFLGGMEEGGYMVLSLYTFLLINRNEKVDHSQVSQNLGWMTWYVAGFMTKIFKWEHS